MPSTTEPVPAPRLAALWACLTYGLATLTLAWPALTGLFLINPTSDQYIGGFPVRQFAAESITSGNGFPLWNPYLFGGMPYIAAMNGDTFYPTFLLRLLLPIDVGMSWGMILHLFLAGCFAYWFLRSSRFSFAASLIGGLAYMMGGWTSSLVGPGHDGKLFIAALFPLTLLALHWGVRDGKRWAWGVLALISGLGVLTPHPQLYQYLLLGAGAYGLMLAFGAEQRLPRNTALGRLGLALGAVLLGWLIGAIQFAPVLEYVSWSPRAGGKGWEHAVSYSFPIEELINVYLPQFSGLLGNYWGRNGIHFHSEYIGASVLLLAGAGFGWGRRADSRFWLGFLIVSLLWALGGHTPFYNLVYWIVPGAKYFRAPSTIFFLTTFAVAVFAAKGTERLLATGLSRNYLLGWLGFGVVMAALAGSGMLREVFAGIVHPDLEGVFRDPEGMRDMAIGGLRSLFFLGLAATIAWAVMQGKVSKPLALAAFVAVITVDLWSVERHYWRFSPPAREMYAGDAIIDYLKAQPQPGRVFAAAVQRTPAAKDPFLSGDALMVHDIRLATGYHGNQIGRYDRLVGDRLQNVLNPAFWQVANVRWFIYNDSTPLSPLLTRVMGPVTNAAGTPIWLFRTAGENPAAWVTPAIMKQPDDVVLGALSDPRFPVASVALFDTAAAVQGEQLTVAPAPLAITASFSRYDPGHLELELSAPAPAKSALIVSENFYPGWRALVDGQPVEVHRADLSMMGIALPAGARKVELRFESPRYELGRLITLVSIGIALAAIVLGLLMPAPRTANA